MKKGSAATAGRGDTGCEMFVGMSVKVSFCERNGGKGGMYGVAGCSSVDPDCATLPDVPFHHCERAARSEPALVSVFSRNCWNVSEL